MRHNTVLLFCFLFSLTICMNACSNLSKNEGQNQQLISVALKLTGDYGLEITQDPLTKATSTDAYGINVYYDRESDGVTNDVFAYGLFDNVPAMTITLLSGHKYRFACALIKDAKNVLYYGQAFGNSYSGYAYPFQTSSSGSTQLGNRFIINEDNIYLSGIGSGGVHLKGTSSSPSSSYVTNYASVNRFYGETDQYTPVPNGTVEIYLKRVVFGARFVVNGVQEGSVKVTCGSFFNRTYTGDNAGTETIYTFEDPYACWNWEQSHSDPYSYVPTVSINYTSDRGGSLWNLSNSQTVTFKRNVMTTVTINLTPDLSGAYFTLTEEPMGADNDINIGINGNTLIDITVNPNN